MSWLDKLLGRGKDAVQDVQDKAEDAYGGVKEKISGNEAAGTEVPGADEGAARARDEAEDRIPPGSG